MFEIHDLSTAAMQTELDYRRNQLIGARSSALAPRGRWWRRRETYTR